VLKNADPAVLDALDAQLAEVGIDVVARRTKTIRSFNQVFTRLYREVAV
jgi:recombinational DNA repair ATPase RecF